MSWIKDTVKEILCPGFLSIAGINVKEKGNWDNEEFISP